MTEHTVLVPAGAFTMGDDRGRPDERPAHLVFVDAFRIGVTPVTNREYAAFIDAAHREPPPFWNDERFNNPEQPVVGVNWFEAMVYCEWLSRSTGAHLRLPTEAEREKATRGGIDGANYPWGNDAGPDDGRFPQDAPSPVGLSTPNGYGLFDMAYNVHEWCSDWYAPAYDPASPATNPDGPLTGKRRTSRGGAWRHQVKVSRCAARSSLDPTFEYNDYGFRVVLEV
ncbi:MAG TPA: SUMF1/EgtB/PvdO family nonheme iron enzyme [Dehalococcoidia bacterium]